MKTSVVAKALAQSLLQSRALVELLAQQLDNAVDLASALAADALSRENAHEAASAPQAQESAPLLRVFGRREPIGADVDEAPVAPDAVGIVPAENATLSVKG